MKSLSGTLWLTLLLALGSLCGCKKHVDEAEGDAAAKATGEAVVAKPLTTTGQEIIPGENAVKDALAKKQYDVALQHFTALKAAVATPDQNEEYLSLYGQMRTELEDAAPKDAKAAEALATFRILRNGR